MFVCPPVIPSTFRMERLCSQSVDFHEFLYLKIFQNLSGKFGFASNVTRIKDNVYDVLYKFIQYLDESL